MASAPTRLRTSTSDLPVDRLNAARASLEVVLLSNQSYPEDSDCGNRRPHRHDYHELIWSRRGIGSHLIDGQRSVVEPSMVTVIGRGQVHVFERAADLDGALVRFGDEMLQVDAVARANPSWLVGFQGPHAVLVPDSDGDGGALQLYDRFVDVLERNFAWCYVASEYADRLGVPQAVLSRALAEITGRRTKELITDRRMLEAVRLLRFTDFSIGEVGALAGFSDQLYFSRAFKRYYGESPTEYRDRVRGR